MSTSDKENSNGVSGGAGGGAGADGTAEKPSAAAAGEGTVGAGGAGAGAGAAAGGMKRVGSSKKGAASRKGGVSVALIARSSPNERKIGEPDSKYLPRITHLNLNDQGLTFIENLNVCGNLKVLYLYDNKITSMENIQAPLLTHLYLQNNEITTMCNLGHLPRLAKLFLDRNAISRVEGLERCPHLEELYVSGQRLKRGVELTFDYASLETIGQSMRILKAGGNNMTSVVPLALLNGLDEVDLSNNKISEAKELAPFLQYTPYLRKMDFRGNPFCKKPKYRDQIVMMSQSLSELDRKDIDPKQRQYLQRLEARKKGGGRGRGGGRARGRGGGAAAGGRGGKRSAGPYQPPAQLGSRPGRRKLGAAGFSAATADSAKATSAAAARRQAAEAAMATEFGAMGLGVAGVRANSAASSRASNARHK